MTVVSVLMIDVSSVLNVKKTELLNGLVVK